MKVLGSNEPSVKEGGGGGGGGPITDHFKQNVLGEGVG